MARIRRGAIVIAATFAIVSAVPALAADHAFTLHNHTRHIIKSLSVSPSGADRWSEDILGQDILDDHTDLVVRFPREDRACKWDVRVKFKNGSTAQVSNVDFCAASYVVIQ